MGWETSREIYRGDRGRRKRWRQHDEIDDKLTRKQRLTKPPLPASTRDVSHLSAATLSTAHRPPSALAESLLRILAGVPRCPLLHSPSWYWLAPAPLRVRAKAARGHLAYRVLLLLRIDLATVHDVRKTRNNRDRVGGLAFEAEELVDIWSPARTHAAHSGFECLRSLGTLGPSW